MVKKKLFIPDKLNAEALEILEQYEAIEVDYRPGLPIDEKLRAAADASAIILRSATTIDEAFLAAAPELEVIVRAGVGVDNVDVDGATRRGVVVQNVPDGNTRSAAEHTIALILALSRNVSPAHASLLRGEWERSKFTGTEILGKTLGVIGLGKIGRHVVEMSVGLGFQLLAFDPFIAPQLAEEMHVELVKDVGELASRCDYLTVHVPKSQHTLGLIGEEVLSKARDGIRIINCARGGIVDEGALLSAIESGKVAGAALDVFESEPPGDNALIRHPLVVATPHLGAATHEAQENVAVSAARLIGDFFETGKLHSPVNAVILDPELKEGLEPYGNLAERLGRLQAQLLEGNPQRVTVKFYGKVFEPKVRDYLACRVLEGFLRDQSVQPVNFINARYLAKEQGLAIEEVDEGSSRYFEEMMKVEIVADSGVRVVGGSIRGRRGLRLVSLDDYIFDAVFEGVMLLTKNEDRPGMIGNLGQVLAAKKLNISSMALGRDKSGGTAMSIVNIDGVDARDVEEELSKIDGILWAKIVVL